MSEYQKIYHSAKRPVDVWTNYLYYTFSMRFVWLIRNTRITPNQLTVFSLIIAVIGCFCFALGTRPSVIWGLVLVQLSYVFDCADGQLARYKQMFSPIGGWLDQMADRIKEFFIFFSLAYGYSRYHTDETIWVWAMIALFSLYMLEYYGQIMKSYRDKIAASFAVSPASDASDSLEDEYAEPADPVDTFTKMRRFRSFIPFHGFHIGEQYAALLIFIAFNAVYPFFVFVACLGLLMNVYRPAVDFMKMRRGAV